MVTPARGRTGRFAPRWAARWTAASASRAVAPSGHAAADGRHDAVASTWTATSTAAKPSTSSGRRRPAALCAGGLRSAATTDCSLFAVLLVALRTPDDTAAKAHLAEAPSLVAYVARVRALLWSDLEVVQAA
jgi:hypothetical protein